MTPQQRIRDVYGFDFPNEFFTFREFLGQAGGQQLGSVCDMGTAAPFDIAAGEPLGDHADRPLWAGRYYYDLPEFITVFHGGMWGRHWGYFFDDPGNKPPVVVWYYHADSIRHNFAGNTLFEAVRDSLERNVAQMEDEGDDEDEENEWAETLEKAKQLRKILARFWGRGFRKKGDKYDGPPDRRRELGETIQEMGVVSPENWYRPLSASLYPAHDSMWPPQPDLEHGRQLIAEARLALREGFPATALELGHNLWPFAHVFPECYELLDEAYTRLDRLPLIRLLHAAREFRAWGDAQHRRADS